MIRERVVGNIMKYYQKIRIKGIKIPEKDKGLFHFSKNNFYYIKMVSIVNIIG